MVQADAGAIEVIEEDPGQLTDSLAFRMFFKRLEKATYISMGNIKEAIDLES